MQVFPFYFLQLIAIVTAQRALYFSISLASPSSNAAHRVNSTGKRQLFPLVKCNSRNRIDAGQTFVTILELSQLFVAPIFNLFHATWNRRLPKA